MGSGPRVQRSMTRMNRPWLSFRVSKERLQKLVDEGLSNAQIAARWSESDVEAGQVAHTLKYYKIRRTKEQIAKTNDDLTCQCKMPDDVIAWERKQQNITEARYNKEVREQEDSISRLV